MSREGSVVTIYRLEEGRISMLGKGMSSARPWASSSGGSSFPAAAAVMWRDGDGVACVQEASEGGPRAVRCSYAARRAAWSS